MPKVTEPTDVSPEILERALLLACQRVADSPQKYEEADTADGWYEEFVRQAVGNFKPLLA